MIFLENESKKILINNLKSDENVTSSHWKKYHRDFKVNSDGSIEGVIGFGGFEKKTLIRSFLHKNFQKRFRKLAIEYNNKFRILDSVMNKITDLQNRTYDLDALRQTLTLYFLKNKLKNYENFNIAIVIGDGFACMSSLLLASKFVKKVILINLSKTLLVDIEYFSKISNYYDFKYCLVNEEKDLIHALNSEFNLVTIQASNQSFLKLISADLIINIASMQEMSNEVIHQYFEDMREISKKKDVYFYCCNREEKKLPDGTVISFKKYPWKEHDEVLIDDLCPWHQEYYAFKPPFYRRYDGPIRHRLVKLN
ncbi:hypothetical protein LEP1GSC089_0846 [Leptospira interrogans serovar Autumnalis str. LP101]|uniref:hypothetical protein n=1 Tax=Leptospira interrogans TaxID=173 RepID=UPI0002BA6FBC|nr:hypothetical protein [Leptospira interrogans]EMN52382.1 hypothetical protein LEP1GSC089_0846 [Leptospira interrogans serovar Autumnalis str. LP101]EMN79521.1 hypothetical protein LEP1GSC106_2703 [Leptospira interrogans serovar Grippotyphosa str. UI 12764]